MSQIAVGEAAFEGFRVIARRPLAVVVWGLALLVLTAGPTALYLGNFLPAFFDLMRPAGSGGEPSPEDMFALQARLMALNPLLMLTSLVIKTLLMCAVFRAVLTPRDDRFFYLRLGKAELMVGLVYLCLSIMLWIAFVVGILLVLAVCAAMWFASKGLAIALGIVAGLALLAAMAWTALRLSMALPMSFAERRFRFFEAWTLTRGEGGALFLIGLLLIAILILMEAVIGGVVGGAMLAFFAGHPPSEGAVEAFFAQPVSDWATQLAPFAVVGGVALALLGAAFYAVMYAPWAAAYRMLVPAPAEAAEAAA